MSKNIDTKNPLGNKIKYISEYDSTLLFPVKRKFARENMNIDPALFQGVDIWNCYEVSWLDKNGKPITKIARIVYPSDSRCIVESKSLKLYLNSFNMTKFNKEKSVIKTIKKDLDELLKTEIYIEFFDNVKKHFTYLNVNKANIIDYLDVEIDEYFPNSNLCEVEKAETAEHEIFSNLLKTNCPVTGQPDWGTVHIKYLSDRYIIEESLLKYIISYRNAQDFHEACCEKIFCDIYKLINPKKLFVKCYYTRRGGVDINPVRVTGYDIEEVDYPCKVWRQ